MWNKVKGFLIRGINMLTGALLGIGVIAYVLYTGVVATLVLNDLRVDTYVEYGTGAQLVLLVFLIVWVPLWAVRKLTPGC